MGDTRAMVQLGDYSMKGGGVTQDKKKAIELYQQAARMGNVNAMIKLCVWYAEGDFDTQDKVNAILWFQQAVDLHNTHKMKSSAPCEDDDEVQQAKEQFIELLRQADEMSATDTTKLGIHLFDGVDTEQDNRRTVRPDWIIHDINKAYAIVHLAISLMKEKTSKQGIKTSVLIQQAHAIQKSVEIIAQGALFGDVDPQIVRRWGVQVLPEFPRQFYCIVYTIARFLLEQLKKKQH